MRILAIGDFQGKLPKKLDKILDEGNYDIIMSVGDHGGIEDWREWLIYMFRKLKKGEEFLNAEEYFGKKNFKELEKKDFNAAKKIFNRLNNLGKNKPVAFIFGNTDDGWYNYPFDRKIKTEKKKVNIIRKMRNLIDINYKARLVNGIYLAGFGGYMDTDYMVKKNSYHNREGLKRWRRRVLRYKKSRDKLFSILNKLRKRDFIAVFHYPPKGIFDIIREKDNPYSGNSAGIGFFRDAVKRYKPKMVLCGHMHEYQGMNKLYGVPVINPGDAGEGKCAIIDVPNNNWNKIKVKFIK